MITIELDETQANKLYALVGNCAHDDQHMGDIRRQLSDQLLGVYRLYQLSPTLNLYEA